MVKSIFKKQTYQERQPGMPKKHTLLYVLFRIVIAWKKIFLEVLFSNMLSIKKKESFCHMSKKTGNRNNVICLSSSPDKYLQLLCKRYFSTSNNKLAGWNKRNRQNFVFAKYLVTIIFFKKRKTVLNWSSKTGRLYENCY